MRLILPNDLKIDPPVACKPPVVITVVDGPQRFVSDMLAAIAESDFEPGDKGVLVSGLELIKVRLQERRES